jgi:activator of HSP90 ATPase
VKYYLEHILSACCYAATLSQLLGGQNMPEYSHPAPPARITTRRQIIAAVALSLGGLAAGKKLSAQTPQESMKQVPSTSANDSRTSLHQENIINAAPSRIYEALLDSKQFAAFSGMPADIDRKPGGAFTMFGGLIMGRNVELTPNVRIVQAWRPSHWDPSVYSIVRFDLKPQGAGSLVVLDHTGFPQGEYDHLYSGWTGHYFEPLKKFLT